MSKVQHTISQQIKSEMAAHGFELCKPRGEDDYQATFHNAATDQEITIQVSHARGKAGRLVIAARFPQRTPTGATVYTNDLPEVKITVDAAKAPAAIISDIERRLLPEYARVWPMYTKRRDESNGYLTRLEDGRKVLEESGLVTFRAPSKYTSYQADDDQSFAINAVQKMDQVYAKCSLSGSQVKLDLSGLSTEQALRVIRALSEG